MAPARMIHMVLETWREIGEVRIPSSVPKKVMRQQAASQRQLSSAWSMTMAQNIRCLVGQSLSILLIALPRVIRQVLNATKCLLIGPKAAPSSTTIRTPLRRLTEARLCSHFFYGEHEKLEVDWLDCPDRRMLAMDV